MASIQIRREEQGNGTLLRVEGRLDGAAAWMLRHALEAARAQPLVVDFTRVREFQDLAIAVLSPVLAGRAAELRGVDHHHRRMFRYFGVAVPEAPPYGYAEERLTA